MKSLALFLALVCLGSSVQGQKLFHEHLEDFLDVIIDQSGATIFGIVEQYLEYDEFNASLEFLTQKDFRDIIYEMESLPEFVAVVEFLERDNIDITWIIDLFNSAIDSINVRMLKRRTGRQQISGTDFNSYLTDLTAAFPKEQLAALYDQKMEEDEVFKNAMENLYSDEWNQVWGNLLASEQFQAELQVLADNGIDAQLIFNEILAIFGQL